MPQALCWQSGVVLMEGSSEAAPHSERQAVLAHLPSLALIWLQHGVWYSVGLWWSSARVGKPPEGAALLMLCPRVAHWLAPQLLCRAAASGGRLVRIWL